MIVQQYHHKSQLTAFAKPVKPTTLYLKIKVHSIFRPASDDESERLTRHQLLYINPKQNN